MRVLLACLIVLACLVGSAVACWNWGVGKVGTHVSIDTSCRLLNLAEENGMLTRSQRFDIVQRVAASEKLSQTARNAAAALRIGCPRH
jgi:hypothetical protein